MIAVAFDFTYYLQLLVEEADMILWAKELIFIVSCNYFARSVQLL